MEIFLGIVSVAIVASITIRLATKYQDIALVIVSAFILRISTALINLYITTLPDGGIDASGFESRAWGWGEGGLIEAFSHFFEGGASYVYSNLASLIYAIFGRSPLILESISVLAGVYCVVLVWKLSLEVWGERSIAKKSAWLVAVYPILILYSSLTMREVFITLLLIYSMLHVVLWVKTRKNRYALIALMAFFLQIFLHPGMAIAGFLFMGLLLLYSIKSSFISLIVSFSLNVRQFLVIVSSLLFGLILFIYISTTSVIDLVGYSGWLTIDKVDGLVDRASIMQTGAASYPSWLMADSPLQFLLLLIPKLFYFLFSPFPWDISKFSHILGLLDGMVFIMLFFSIFSHRKYIKSNPQALILLVFVVFLSLIFSIAVGNFGTGLRHRSKILPIFIVIVAPFIYRLLFFNKKN
jgi:hypothetical protein